MKKFKEEPDEKDPKAKSKSDFQRMMKVINFFMPYVLSVLFVVVLFSLLPFLGKFGEVVSWPFKGLLSIAGSVFLALMLLYHAIVWKYDVKHKICIRRVICSVIAIICVSMLQHIIQYEDCATTNGFEFFELGLQGVGGGFIGGFLSYLLVEGVTIFGAAAIVLVILLFMLLQMFNITPVSMVVGLFRLIFGKSKKKKEAKEPKEKPEKIKKGKKVAVFDDTGDTLDEKFEEAAKSNKPAYLDISKYINTDEHTIRNDQNQKYNSLDEQLISSRGSSSDQLKPYDDRYSNAPQRRNLEVTSSRVETYDDDEDDSYSQLRPASNMRPVDDYAASSENDEIYVPSMRERYEEDKNQRGVPYSDEQFDAAVSEEKRKRTGGPTPTFEFNADIRSERAYKTQQEVESENEFEIEEHTVSISSFGHNSVSEPRYEPEREEPVYDAYDEPDYEEPSYDEPKYEESYAPVESPKKENELSYLDDLIEKSTKKPQSEKTNLDEQGVEFDDASSYIPTDVKRKEAPKPAPPKKKAVKRNYKFPPIQFLQEPLDNADSEEAKAELQENARIIVDTLNNFKIGTKISDITRGPTVTRYELVPEAGVRVRSIAGLVDDIALNLAAEGIRIECPIPGKSAVGIEVPNKVTSMVYLRELIDSKQFKGAKGKLTCALGKSISGENIYVDIEKTPHLLVAGATGMGKSVCINSLLVSLLYRTTPDDVRLILIDPKKVELSNYNGVPHLLVPVVCEPKKSLGALQWAVTEMENRFETIEAAGVRNLIEFNEKVDKGYDADKMARIVIVIDELADLKMTVPDIEGHITRLTQKARAAGIHIIIGTQRPSVDVITGLIKSNIPSRISFRVPSQVDSRTILDEVGAEKLVSRGDMLVKIVGALRPARVQGSFVSADEIEEVINFWKENSPAIYDEDVMHQIDANAAKMAKNDKNYDDGAEGSPDDDGDLDSAFYDALELATEMGKISSSFLQRKLRLGFQRAARIIDQMEECGYIGEANGSKPRDVLITKEDYQEIMMRRSDD